jgi:hypothetical protein
LGFAIFKLSLLDCYRSCMPILCPFFPSDIRPQTC